MKFLTGELNPWWDCHTLRSCMALWKGRELISAWEGVTLMDSSVNLPPLWELLISQHMIFLNDTQ